MNDTKRIAIEREVEILRELSRRSEEPHVVYAPYPKQEKFHALGASYSERAFFAGNQLGKTLSAAMETFYHLSGLYPGWWVGRRFENAVTWWVGGDTGETIRDTTQRLLFDRPGKLFDDDIKNYIGIIPLRLIVDKPRLASGIADLYDHIKIKHVSGGNSYCYFKAYSKGRKKWQGETVDGILFDEEPPPDIYSEGLTRTNKGQTGQFAYLTFTPLLGMSTVVYKFLKEPSANQVSLTMTIDDVEHYTDKERESIIASYPDHEREARARGIPIMGSGRVFQIPESMILEDRIEVVPAWWRQIAGIDFGWDHPTAAVLIYHDTDTDTVHVRSTFRVREHTPLMFAPGVSPWGNIPFAWPHDGLQHDKGSGERLAEQYRKAGLRMLWERATFDDGSSGLEAGVMEMADRMKSGRLKVDRELTEWIEEFRMYHRKDGIIQKIMDDLLSATRYAIMMLRYATAISGMVESAPEPEMEPDY